MRKSKIVWGLFAVSLFLFLFILCQLLGNRIDSFDEKGLEWIVQSFGGGMLPFFEAVTVLGSGKGIGIIGLIFLFWLWWAKKDFIGTALFVVGVAFGNGVNVFVKKLVERPRPPFSGEIHSTSFPSGHAMVSFILFMLMTYFIFRHVKSKAAKTGAAIFSIVIVLLIGLSRPVLQVHYPTDVVSGYLLGYIWSVLVIILYEWMYDAKVLKK